MSRLEQISEVLTNIQVNLPEAVEFTANVLEIVQLSYLLIAFTGSLGIDLNVDILDTVQTFPKFDELKSALISISNLGIDGFNHNLNDIYGSCESFTESARLLEANYQFNPLNPYEGIPDVCTSTNGSQFSFQLITPQLNFEFLEGNIDALQQNYSITIEEEQLRKNENIEYFLITNIEQKTNNEIVRTYAIVEVVATGDTNTSTILTLGEPISEISNEALSNQVENQENSTNNLSQDTQQVQSEELPEQQQAQPESQIVYGSDGAKILTLDGIQYIEIEYHYENPSTEINGTLYRHSSGSYIYEVGTRDTLSRIASHFGTDIETIKGNNNNIENPDRIDVGEFLRLEITTDTPLEASSETMQANESIEIQQPPLTFSENNLAEDPIQTNEPSGWFPRLTNWLRDLIGSRDSEPAINVVE